MNPTQIRLRQALLSRAFGGWQILQSANHQDVVRAVVDFVDYFGSYPIGVVHRTNRSIIVYDPAVVSDRNGYAVYNCYLYDRATAGHADSVPRCFTDAVEAVVYYLRSEPIGGHGLNYGLFRFGEVICPAPGR